MKKIMSILCALCYFNGLLDSNVNTFLALCHLIKMLDDWSIFFLSLSFYFHTQSFNLNECKKKQLRQTLERKRIICMEIGFVVVFIYFFFVEANI